MADLDGRVDQFAAGIMLYEMLTGRRPFGGKNYNQIITAILLAPCPPPRALRPDLPPAVEAVIMRALSRDRADRYPDVGKMHDALLAAAHRTTPSSGRVASGVAADAADASGAAPSICSAATQESLPASDVMARPASVALATHSRVVPEHRGGRARPLILSGLAVLAVTITAAVVLLGRTAADPPAGARTPAALPAAPPAPANALAPDPPPPPRPPAAETVPPAEPDAGRTALVPDAAESTLPPVAAVEPAVDAAAVPDGPALPRTVRFTLTGLPEGARVAVDGREIDGRSFSVPRTDGVVSVAVSAPGYLPWRRSVSARAGAAIPVRLLRRTGTIVRTMPADSSARDAGSSSPPEPGDGGDAAHRHVPTFGAGP
jgi:hypothetical protein